MVKYGRESNEKFKIEEDTGEGLDEFYNHIYHEIKELWDKELENIRGRGTELSMIKYIQ